MTEWTGKRYWLIGASAGLGEALAHKLGRLGAEVIVSARSEGKLAALVDELPVSASYQTIDVQDIDSIRVAVKAVGPVDGVVYLAGAYWPFGAQAGTLSLAECMHADLRKTGVKVQVINPGFIRTQLTDKNDFKMPFLMEPEAAAQQVVEHMSGSSFKKSFPFGFSLFFRLAQFLPDGIYYRLFG